MQKTSLINEKTLPQDIDAEKSVLGSILIDSDCIYEVFSFLSVNDFYSEQHQFIYESMINIINRGEAINQITVARELANKDRLSSSGGAAYLSHIIANVPTSLHIQYYGKIVKNMSIFRKGISMAHKISVMGYEASNVNSYISEIDKEILELQKDVALPKLISPSELAGRGFKRYEELNKGLRRGVYTGYKDLDNALGGVFGGELCYIGARPGLGKTTIALSMARYCSEHFGNVLMASLEQPWGDILDRIVSSELEISPRKLRNGNYSDELFSNISVAIGKVADTKLWFYDSGGNIDGKGRNVNSIYSVANHMKSAYGLNAIFIDYLGLLTDDSWNRSRYEKISEISRKLKELCTDLDVPVFCLCQLNRESEHRIGDRIPKISEIRDSGNIEADADIILFLYRDDYYEDIIEEEIKKGNNVKGKAQLIIAKHRQFGEVMGTAVELLWNKDKRCYVDA